MDAGKGNDLPVSEDTAHEAAKKGAEVVDTDNAALTRRFGYGDHIAFRGALVPGVRTP